MKMLVSPNYYEGDPLKHSAYLDTERLADVMALIQILAQAAGGTIRSESGLTDVMQGKPRAKGVLTWIDLADSHREFFRVERGKDQKGEDYVRAALISRYVSAQDEVGKREPITPEVTAKLLELALSLHDREVARKERWKSWLPLIVAIILGACTIAAALFRKC